jgi:hypothetical protein
MDSHETNMRNENCDNDTEARKRLISEYQQSTYCSGPNFKLKKDITKGEFIKALESINKRFSAGHFVPDNFTEGGIRFIFDNPTNDKLIEGYYKAIRFFSNGNKFPWISGNEMETWKDRDNLLFKTEKTILKEILKRNNLEEEQIVKSNKKGELHQTNSTCLKSFRFALKWEQEDLNIIREEFSKIGWVFNKTVKLQKLITKKEIEIRDKALELYKNNDYKIF